MSKDKKSIYVMHISQILDRLSHWIWFSLALTMLPLCFKLWKIYSRAKFANLGECIQKTLSNGELLLLCMTCIGVAISEALKLPENKTGMRLAQHSIIGLSFWFGGFALLTFRDASLGLQDSLSTLIASTALFILTILLCVFSLSLPKKK